MQDSTNNEKGLHPDFELHNYDPERQFQVVCKVWYKQREQGRPPTTPLSVIGVFGFGLTTKQTHLVRQRHYDLMAKIKQRDVKRKIATLQPKLLVVDPIQKVA